MLLGGLGPDFAEEGSGVQEQILTWLLEEGGHSGAGDSGLG